MAFDERAKKVLIEWESDPSKGIDGVKKLAKEIRAVQKDERDLATVHKELGDETKSLGDRVMSAAGSLGSFGDIVSKVSAVVNLDLIKCFEMAVQAGAKLVDVGKELAKEFYNDFREGEKDVIMYGQYEEAVRGMISASDGLIKKDELEQTARRLTNAEYKASAEQLRDVAVATETLKQKSEEGVTREEALSRITQSIATGNVRGLKELGLQVDANLSLYERQEQIYRQLHNTYGDMTTAARGDLAERIKRENDLLRLQEEYRESLYKNDSVRTTIHNWEKMRHQQEMNWLEYKISLVVGLSKAYEGLLKFSGLAGVWSQPQAPTAETPRDPDEALLKSRGAMTGRTVMRFPESEGISVALRRGGRGGGGKSEAELEAERMMRQRKLEEDWISKISDAAMKAEDDETKRTLAYRHDIGRVDDAAKQAQKIQKEQEFAIAVRKSDEEMTKQHDIITQFVAGPLEGLASGFLAAAEAAATGADSIGHAMLMMLKQVMMSIATQCIVKAAYEVAEGIACIASIVRAGEAPGHFLAAAKYGAVAVLAGGAAVGMAAAGAGGGNAASGAAGTASAPRPGSTPSYGKKVEDNKPININVYFGDPTSPSADMLMTKQIQARLAA